MSTQKLAQFYSKLPKFGNNPEALQQVNGKTNSGTSVQWNILFSDKKK